MKLLVVALGLSFSGMAMAGQANLICSMKAGDNSVKTTSQKISLNETKVVQYKVASVAAGSISVNISGASLELAVRPTDSKEYFVIAAEGTVANGAHLLVNSQELDKLLDVACYVKAN